MKQRTPGLGGCPHVHAPLLLAALAFGCSSSRTDIEGDDNTLFGAARATFPTDEAAPGDSRAGFRLDADFGRGEFGQDLSPGEVVQLDDIAFSGGDPVEVEFEHTFLGLGGYIARESSTGVRLEGSFGLGASLLDIQAAQAGVSESTDVRGFGPYVGGSLSYAPVERLSLFVEARVLLGFISTLDSLDIATVAAGAAWSVGDHLLLSAGVQDWDYDAEREDGSPDPSDLDLGLAGPFVRLEYVF
ncbi:MAG: hypothetical protein AAF682_16195 [Planctomycetota bacterium]